ncbi:MAG: dienelactone hydrolase family protein [Alphaproteobacteria bacterium]|nr:dienelactone hydrolase family protein [Alphaproteobacteria bacterium]
MGQTITLTAIDGFTLKAYRADPEGDVRGGIVVIQEIFGVNSHIRSVVDGFAAEGYSVIAPQIYDRSAPDIELGYTPEDVQKGRDIRAELGFDKPLLDLQAAVSLLKSEGLAVGTVGYCYGGALAWRSAAKLEGLSAAIGYYGGAAMFKDEAPKCPVLMHYGEKDPMIPSTDGAMLAGLYSNVEAFVYPADHGFNCDQRSSYDGPSAALALERSLSFFQDYLG